MVNEVFYQNLINELNETGFNSKLAILPYYYPALLNNALNYYKNANQNNALQATLQVCLPFLQEVLASERKRIVVEKNGAYAISLREEAIVAGNNPNTLIKNIQAIEEI